MALLMHLDNQNDEIKHAEIYTPQKTTAIWNRPLSRQIFVVLGPTTLMFCSGIGLGTAAVTIPQIKTHNSSIHITEDMESWLYSIHGIAALPAVITIPYLNQAKGYKLPFILMCISTIVSFILEYLATSAKHLLIASTLQGLTIGGNVTLGVVIISEFADPKYRGTFLVIKSASYFSGMWLSNAIGTFFSWRNIPLVGILPAVLTTLSCLIWPNSPYWLASKNKTEECKKAFRSVRGKGHAAENELALLITQKPSEGQSKNTVHFLKSTICLRQFYMPFVLNIAMFFLYQSCGKYVCQNYILVIIKEITKNDVVAYTGMLIIDGVTVCGMFIGGYVAAKVNRRTLYLSTSTSTIFFLYILSAYLYLAQFNIIAQHNAVSLGFLILYSFFVSWGPMVLCSSIFSEITPMRFKPFITSTTVCFMHIMYTVFVKLAPFIFKHVGVNGAFAVYGTLTVFPVLFLYFYLPETKNRTLEEIESFFVIVKSS